MSEETQQPDSKNPDVVRSLKNTDRDLEAERAGNPTDAPEVVRKLVVIDGDPDDSPKNDRPIDSAKLAQNVETPKVVRKPIVIDGQAESEAGDRSPKNDRDFKS